MNFLTFFFQIRIQDKISEILTYRMLRLIVIYGKQDFKIKNGIWFGLVCTPPPTAAYVVFHIFEKPRPRGTSDNLPKVTESYRKKVIKVLVQFRGSFSTKIGCHLAQKSLLTAN